MFVVEGKQVVRVGVYRCDLSVVKVGELREIGARSLQSVR